MASDLPAKEALERRKGTGVRDRQSGGRAHLARETRMRQPPENFCVGRFCISGSKPKPARIRLALASAAAAPVALNSSYTWEEGEEDTCLRVQGSQAHPCPRADPLPSLASQQLCHPPAPAVPEAAAPPLATSVAWCPHEEQPAPRVFHQPPPLQKRKVKVSVLSWPVQHLALLPNQGFSSPELPRFPGPQPHPAHTAARQC